MTFVKILKEILGISGQMTYTANGDAAYRSTKNANLDFFSAAGSMRGNPEQAVELFEKAYGENKASALMNLLYLRDVRGGLGEREIFRRCFRMICEKDPSTAVRLFPYVVQYGRYDDLFTAIATKAEKELTGFTAAQLLKDLEALEKGENVSLLAKWMPSVNASSEKTRETARFFIRQFETDAASYRKMLSMLRRGRILENNLREKDYTFDYQTVPSTAMHKYRAAFLRNDEERYEAYVRAVTEGEARVHAAGVFPYQIICEYKAGMNETERLAMQMKWDEMKKGLKTAGRTIVVRDGSGSMLYPRTAILNSTALAILYAELLQGEFKGKFITFSSRPELAELEDGEDLYEKLRKTYTYNDCSNTNIAKVYDLLLQVSRRITDPSEYIQRVVIISDMQFDKSMYNVPTFDEAKEKFERAGIPMPEVVFWNVNAERVQFAADTTEKNIRYVSGCTPQVIKALLEDNAASPEEFMMNTLRKYEAAAKEALGYEYDQGRIQYC